LSNGFDSADRFCALNGHPRALAQVLTDLLKFVAEQLQRI
jgi:hypothetical protein